ncbi:hypothetical protein Mapa_013770 [Marchantia paleacea]|nr:hypothetical protein Mapa_013770 [Marchantia paleacea]
MFWSTLFSLKVGAKIHELPSTSGMFIVHVPFLIHLHAVLLLTFSRKQERVVAREETSEQLIKQERRVRRR